MEPLRRPHHFPENASPRGYRRHHEEEEEEEGNAPNLFFY